MKCRVNLVKAEEITLQEMAINHRFKNTRRRATGLLMLARGDKPKVFQAQSLLAEKKRNEQEFEMKTGHA
ncbi:hypothetical protein [Paraburkholderia hospita]|uniref:hypothetical protein n=1 Tax=Paraburkholderia hospita TaxID=169430 RepID=UPI000271C6D4|nr:hypothetical protein [Paraburkholderia hospita]EUC14635.1 hypothetical protein PMI06_006461 [Burkholderia sp. BT03]